MNPSAKLCIITTTMLTFGMGASTQALFARVGGGIYTKAADVGCRRPCRQSRKPASPKTTHAIRQPLPTM